MSPGQKIHFQIHFVNRGFHFDWHFMEIYLLHCVPVTLYDDIKLGQHWLRWWIIASWHHVIACTNVNLSSVRFNDIRMVVISQETPKPSNKKNSKKFTCSKLHYKSRRGHRVNWHRCNQTFTAVLTHCGLMTPYGDIDLGQHWLR